MLASPEGQGDHCPESRARVPGKQGIEKLPKRVYDRAHASFRVFGPTLDPLDVTLALKLPPDYVHRNGEPRLVRTRAGRIEERAPHRMGMWLMSSRECVTSPRLAVHLEWLLDQLEPLAAALVSLRTDGITTDFFCCSSGSSPDPPPMPRVIRQRAAALGITIEIDHHGPAGETNSTRSEP